MAFFCLERVWRVCVLDLRLVYLASFGAVFIKFDADAIFDFAVRDIAAAFGVLLAVLAVLPPYATYKDYEFMGIRSESILF